LVDCCSNLGGDDDGSCDGSTAHGCPCCSGLCDCCHCIIVHIIGDIQNVVDILVKAVLVLPQCVAELDCGQLLSIHLVYERLEGRIRWWPLLPTCQIP
jgi:hypothetical protein